MRSVITKYIFLLLCIALSGLCYACSGSVPAPVGLWCEYHTGPLGIDTPNPRLGWALEGRTARDGNYTYSILVGSDSLALAGGVANMWEYEVVNPAGFVVTYNGGELSPNTAYYWQVICTDIHGNSTSSDISSFETGIFSMDNLQGDWISFSPSSYTGFEPQFRKVFRVESAVKSVRLLVSSEASYFYSANGSGWKSRPQQLLNDMRHGQARYGIYDITDLIDVGENHIDIILDGATDHYVAAPAFKANIRINYEDGSSQVVSTNGSWKYFSGAASLDTEYDTEYYDFNINRIIGQTRNYDIIYGDDAVVARRIYDSLYPGNRTEVRTRMIEAGNDISYRDDTLKIVRFENTIASGNLGFTIEGPRDAVVDIHYFESQVISDSLYHAIERIKPQGTPADRLVLSGTSDRYNSLVYKQNFNTLVISSDYPVVVENIMVEEITTTVEALGNIRSSNEKIEFIHLKNMENKNSRQLSNLFSGPCKDSDIESWLYNFNVIHIFENTLYGLSGENLRRYFTYGMNPLPSLSNSETAAIINRIIMIPWHCYLFYGDTDILSRSYPAIKAYVDHLNSYAYGGLIRRLPGGETVTTDGNQELINSSFLYINTALAGRIAGILGLASDELDYRNMANMIRHAVNEKYLDSENNTYASGTLMDAVVPMFFGITPREQRADIAERIASQIKREHSDISTLTLDTVMKMLLSCLSRNGYTDLALRLIDKVYNIAENHPALVSEADSWLFGGLAGIIPDETLPGFRRTILRPAFTASVEQFYASHRSPYGEIITEWQITGNNKVDYRVQIPTGCSARLFRPEPGTSFEEIIEICEGIHRFNFRI